MGDEQTQVQAQAQAQAPKEQPAPQKDKAPETPKEPAKEPAKEQTQSATAAAPATQPAQEPTPEPLAASAHDPEDPHVADEEDRAIEQKGTSSPVERIFTPRPADPNFDPDNRIEAGRAIQQARTESIRAKLTGETSE